MKPEALENFKATDDYAELLAKREQINAMLQSDAYQIWVSWLETVIDTHTKAAIYGPDAESREKSRIFVLAFKEFKEMPLFLGEILNGEASAHGEQTPSTVEMEE